MTEWDALETIETINERLVIHREIIVQVSKYEKQLSRNRVNFVQIQNILAATGHLHKKYSTTNERKEERRKGRMNPINKIFGDDKVCGWNIPKIER